MFKKKKKTSKKSSFYLQTIKTKIHKEKKTHNLGT